MPRPTDASAPTPWRLRKRPKRMPTSCILLLALCIGIWVPIHTSHAQSQEVRTLEAELSRLRLRYTDNHPEIIRIREALGNARRAAKAPGSATGPRPSRANDEALEYLLRRGIAGTRAAPSTRVDAHIFQAVKVEHPGGLHSRAQIRHARARLAAGAQPQLRAFNRLLAHTRKHKAHRPEPAATVDVPAYYVDTDGNRKASAPLTADAAAAYSCAILYRLAPKRLRREALRCADRAVDILTAWSRTNRGVAGVDGALVMTYAGAGLTLAAELLSDYPGWDARARARLKSWVAAVYLPAAAEQSFENNNRGAWGVFGKMAAHHLLDDRPGLVRDVAELRAKIDAVVGHDGSIPAETGRDKYGIWYSYFALAPLTAAAEIAHNATGEDLFRYQGQDGAGIEDALAYLYRFSRRPAAWPHFKNLKELAKPTARGWPKDLFEAMGGVYDDGRFDALLRDARPVMLLEHHFAWSVPSLLRPTRVQD